jgi:hypothetical protein
LGLIPFSRPITIFIHAVQLGGDRVPTGGPAPLATRLCPRIRSVTEMWAQVVRRRPLPRVRDAATNVAFLAVPRRFWGMVGLLRTPHVPALYDHLPSHLNPSTISRHPEQGVERHIERPDGPAWRPDGPRSGQSAPVGRTVRACAEQFRVPSFVLCLLARFAELTRNPVV